MFAAVLHANEDLHYEEYPTPQVEAGMVKIAVKATGICGSDVPRVLHSGAHFYPIVLGHEFSGVVEEVGEGVTKVKVGDHVSGAPLVPCCRCTDCLQGNYALCKHYSFIGSRQQGSFAQYVVLPEMCAVPYDASLSFEQGALFEPSCVALHGILCADYRADGVVAILGGGTIGLFTAQWARILGARRVVVFDIDDDRLELAKKLGADAVINTTKEDFMEEAKRFTRNGNGFDYVFETAGAVATMKMAFELAGNKARLCYIGTPTQDLTFTPKQWENMNRKEFILTGSWMSYSAPYPGKEWEMTAYYFATGALRYDADLIYKKVPMSQAAEAFALYKNPAQVKGKILLINE